MLDGMPSLPRRIASELNAQASQPRDRRLRRGCGEQPLTQRRREQKLKTGAFRGLNVVVYRGFVADDVAKGPVMEAPELPGDSRIPYREVAQTNLRRHAALRIVGAEVELGSETTAPPPRSPTATGTPISPCRFRARVGWHDAHASIAPIEDGETASGTGRVVKPSLRHRSW